MLSYELVASTFRYDPNTGAVYLIGKDTPITTKTKSGKAIRCQIQTADTYKDTTAHAVAWVLLSGQDLIKNHKPQHINGDTFDNRAVNLYLVIEADRDDSPNYYTVIMGDTSLARAIYPKGRKTGDTWVCDAPGTAPLYSDWPKGKAHLYKEHRGAYCLKRWEPVPQWTDPVNLDHFERWISDHEAAEAAYMAEIRRLLALGYTL